jgi:nucleoid-associated protein YgaU
MMRGSWLIVGCCSFICLAGCQDKSKTETGPAQEPQDAYATQPFPEDQVPPAEGQPPRVSVSTPRNAEPDPTPVDRSARTASDEPALVPAPQPKESYAPAVKDTPRYHVVRKNETLQKISMKYYGTTKSWRRIFEANKDQVKNPDQISIGMKLRIP